MFGDHAFKLLKEKLTQAPILVYPQFGSKASLFILETDASDVGVAAVLQQDGHVIAYMPAALFQKQRRATVPLRHPCQLNFSISCENPSDIDWSLYI